MTRGSTGSRRRIDRQPIVRSPINLWLWFRIKMRGTRIASNSLCNVRFIPHRCDDVPVFSCELCKSKNNTEANFKWRGNRGEEGGKRTRNESIWLRIAAAICTLHTGEILTVLNRCIWKVRFPQSLILSSIRFSSTVNPFAPVYLQLFVMLSLQ